MRSSFKNVSIGSISLIIISILILSAIFSVIVTPVIPDSYSLFFGFFIDLLFYFTVLLVSIFQIHKNKINLSHIIGQKKIQLKNMLYFLSLLLLGTIVSVSSIFFLLRLLLLFPGGVGYFELISAELDYTSPILPPFLLRFILGVLVGPFVEEFLFRGILLNKWSERFGIKKAILLSSLLFMVLHINSFFIPQFILGILLAIIYVKTKKLIYPFLLHSINNFIVLLIDYIPLDNEPSLVETETSLLVSSLNIFSVTFFISLLVLSILIIRYSKNIKNELTPFEFNKDRENKIL
ncbi:CPBP family intramembrane glutamic endopeptidase [Alkalibacterium sp. 20]|uniref:CPBP family intramembrane glutamic endopeptidase n=1 Tax=Alkalibacterium sp. 20 TaxID=1798803 RepID=UPI0009004F57|nr:CPBP family intramembrane glutamic endopeptidase [Alkalibacterium sp. 20]OJF91001.1 hypothetical protein AX762_11430 [Alkalibacterium sp. 20]